MDVRLRGGLLALAATLAAAGTRAQQPALPEGVTPTMVKEGKKLFEGRGLCTACHGQAARGGLGPNLADGEWWHSDGSYPAIVAQILAGVPADKARSGVPMPPKGGSSLSEAEVRAVAAYVHSLGGTARAAGDDAARPAAVGAAAGSVVMPVMEMMGMGMGMGMDHCRHGAEGGAGPRHRHGGRLCPAGAADTAAHRGDGPCRT